MIRVACAILAASLAVILGVLFSVDLSPGSVSTTPGSGAMFDAIADHYDTTNKVMSLGSDVSWRVELVKALNLQEGDTVLDLATGTAEVAIALARTDARPRVVGIDPSAKMLQHGREKVVKAGLAGQGRGTVELFQGDAQHLHGMSSKSFDKTCISFGIRNVPDRAAALEEMARVTRPGGIVAVLEFSEPHEGFFAPLARIFVKSVVPRIGAFMSGGARAEYVHLQNSIKDFPLPAAFRNEMISAGFIDVTSRMIHPGGVYLYTSAVP
mmetsp:Transcript_75442/g.151664  ORF Transcript_75442/g.151664 Transcript_75442/m.151664 type:complete len:268 (-) Transcript_75442:141-944(-)